MLSSLNIRNYILLDSLEVDFPKGLVIISGSTGAGKSILLGAVDILLGGKADVAVLRNQEQNCVIEGTFTLGESDGELREILKEEDIDCEDGTLLIRRQIAPSGRSRAFINDLPVTAALLQRIAPLLIDIHSQHQSLQISQDGFRLNALDTYMAKPELLSKVSELYTEKKALETKLESLRAALAKSLQEGDYNASLLKGLKDASLKEGELEELEEELKVLENAETIKESLYACSGALSGSGDDTPGVSVALKEAMKQLHFLEKYYSSMEDFAARLESAKLEIEDIAAEIESLNDKVTLSEDRLQKVQERLSELYRLLKKHNVSTVGELIEIRERLSAEVFSSEDLQGEIEDTEKKFMKVSADYDLACAKLHEAREKAGAKFGASIQKRLRALEMERATFQIALEERPDSAQGRDKVVFRFSAVDPSRLVDASLKASGGELSRIMLSIKAELAAAKTVLPTMIFDEIDTGISGSVADKTGQMICEMGSTMQVFAITHLPQVAAKGTAHFLVAKSSEGTTSITQIEGDARVREIARMLSGSTITDAAIANAKSLLS